jgi:hypothetical protein
MKTDILFFAAFSSPSMFSTVLFSLTLSPFVADPSPASYLTTARSAYGIVTPREGFSVFRLSSVARLIMVVVS